ncbi:MAG: TonB-dependent receptor [Bacteroidota bacterium]
MSFSLRPSAVRFFACCALVLLCAAPLFAQRPSQAQMQERMQRFMVAEISGQIIDDVQGQPLPSATVALYRIGRQGGGMMGGFGGGRPGSGGQAEAAPDTSLVSGAITDHDGQFTFEGLFPGTYLLKVSFVGYEPISVEATPTRQAPLVDMDRIVLSADATLLDEVEVTAEREAVTFAIDRTIYDTKDMPVAGGGTATQVLENIPSVEVDIDGNVSLRGSQNVAILINGRPAPMRGDMLTAFLQQLPANLIDRVEVIPNPSAKYDPEGMAGILNIELREDADLGVGGSIQAGFGTGDKYNIGGSLNAQRGKLRVFANYGFRYEDRFSTGDNFRENFYGASDLIDQIDDGLNNRLNNLLSVTMDYNFARTDVLTLSAQGRQSSRANDVLNTTLTRNTLETVESYDRVTAGEQDNWGMDYRLTYSRTFTPNANEWTAEVRYNQSWADDLDRFTQTYEPLDPTSSFIRDELQINRQDNSDYTLAAQFDLVKMLGATKVEAGYISEFEGLDNAFFSESGVPGGLLTPDVGLNNEFDFLQQVHAAYGIAARSFGKFDTQVGVRLEQAMTTFDLQTTGESFDNDYFSVFPSAFVTYKLTDTKQFRATYSRRIQRPRTRQINPFASFVDPLNLRMGNPYLQPEYTNSYEVSYQQFTRRGSLQITPYYRRTVDVHSRFKTVDPQTDVSTMTFRNFDSRDSYGIESIATMRMGNFSGFLSLSGYKVTTDGSNVQADFSNDAFSWSARGNLTWRMRPGLSLQTFYLYRAPLDVPAGRISAFSILNFGVRQDLFGGKGNLNMSLSDPFDTMDFSFQVGDQFFFQEGIRKRESRVLRLTFTYNFGQEVSGSNRRNRDMGDRDFGGGDVGID